MIKQITYILLVSTLILCCKSENNKTKSNITSEQENDSVTETFWSNVFEYKKHKVTHINDGYGKRLYIDSLNYKIFKEYYVKDSTRIRYEHYDDQLNDTVIIKEYYYNRKLKELIKTTFHNRIPLKKLYYSKNSLESTNEINYESNYKITFNNAVEIAINKGMKKPFEVDISKDSLHWIISIWKTIEFDSITNEGIDKSKGLIINRKNGEVKNVELKRNWVT